MQSSARPSSTKISTGSIAIAPWTAIPSSAAAPICDSPDNQTNRVVVQREMQILDVMTANRDQRIWSVAQGGDLKVTTATRRRSSPSRRTNPAPAPTAPTFSSTAIRK